MNILSLFDGVSCARLALEANGIKVDKYYASEIDKYAVKVTQANRPDTIQLGSVIDLHLEEDIDLLIGGSPCQDLSIAKRDRKGLSGDRSSLFYEYVRILNEIKPKYFILENVASMPKEAKQTITEELFGIEPVMINASLVSAQNRKRLFWVGKLKLDGSYKQIEIPQPEDRGILLKDVLEEADTDRLKSYCIDANYYKGASWEQYKTKGRRQLVKIGHFNSGGQGDRIYSQEGKSVSLSANGGGRGAKTGLYLVNEYNKRVMIDKSGTLGTTMGRTAKQGYQVVDDKHSILRKLHPIECERLQSMPDNWTNPTGDISNTQRYKMCGNAFNVEVVAHIIKHLQ
jgi:DNA-cytosine methyltransferase